MTSIGKFARILSGSAAVIALAGPALAQPAVTPAEGAPDGEIVVTASRVARSGFTAPTPTTVLGEAAVQARGATNVAEVINEIPAFRPSNTPASGARGGGSNGFTVLDLRGLNDGKARTLVLLDGHRVVPATATGFVDVNMIPSALIGRTDVVTGGASAAYGSDAISGVVNLILKDRIQGIEGNVSYGVSDQGDYQEYAANLAAGAEFADGRAHLIAGVEYVNNKGVPDGYASRDWNRQAYQDLNYGTARPAGLPSHNILPNLRFSDVTAPGGIVVGGPLDNTEFLGNGRTRFFTEGALKAGNQMQGGGANDSNAGVFFVGGSNLVNPIRRGSFFSRLTWDFTPNVTGWLEASHAESVYTGFSASARIFAPTPGNIPVSINNPYLPASTRTAMLNAGVTTINVGRVAYDDQFGYDFYNNRTDTSVQRIATGLRGDIFGDWKWDAYYHGESNFVQQNQSTIISNFYAAANATAGPGGSVVCGPITAAQTTSFGAPAAGCVPFNIFGSNQASPGNLGSQAAVNYFLGVGVNDVTTRQNVAAVNLRGDLFELPAGPVSVAGGVEYRKEEVFSTVDPDSQAGRFDLNNFKPIKGEYDTHEVYAETVIPLLKDQTLFKLLEFNAAGRYTDYSTSGEVTTWKAGLTYEPIADLRFRGTQSRDVRAPNLSELYSGAVQGRANATAIGGAQAQTNQITIGNPTLTPEEADTTTYGVVYTPSWFSGFRASADYYQILINDVITTLGIQDVVDRCPVGNVSAFCTTSTGGPVVVYTTPTTIGSVTLQQFNFAARKTNGVDLEFSYAVPADFVAPGQIQLRALGTYVSKFVTVDAAGSIDRVKETVPQWSWNYSINYSLGRFGANATVRAIGETLVNATYLDPTDAGYAALLANPASTTTINDNTRGPTAYLNLSASYDLVEQNKKQLQLFGVVNNVLDRDPPNGAGGNPVGASLYDLVGRAYKVGLRFKY